MAEVNRFAKALKSSVNQNSDESVNQIVTLGRPKGKHSDARYKQAGVWLPRDLITEVKVRLLRENREMSGLVEDLLKVWLGQK